MLESQRTRLQEYIAALRKCRGPYLGDGINAVIHAYDLATFLESLLPDTCALTPTAETSAVESSLPAKPRVQSGAAAAAARAAKPSLVGSTLSR